MRTPLALLTAALLHTACSGASGTEPAAASSSSGSGSGSATRADAQPVVLRMHPPAGARYRFTRQSVRTTDGRAEQAVTEREERLLVIESVAPDGAFRVREQWLSRSRSVGGTALPRPPEQQGLESVVVRYARTARGLYLGEPEVSGTTPANAPWASEELRHRTATEAALPERAVAPGESWPASANDTLNVGGASVRMLLRGSTRLASVEGTIAVLENHGELAIPAATLADDARMEGQGRGESATRLDTRDGFSMESRSRLEMLITVQRPENDGGGGGGGGGESHTVVTEGQTSIRRELTRGEE